MEHRPATMFALNAPKIHSDFGLSVGRDAVHVVLKQHVLAGMVASASNSKTQCPLPLWRLNKARPAPAMLCRISGAEKRGSVFIAVLVRGWIGEKGLSG